MKGIHLRFYTYENRKHGNMLMYEWLLERAKAMGIHGGSAFRAIAGYGRHGILHESHFFELAGDLTVEVDFALADADVERLLDLLRAQNVSVFYLRIPIEYGSIEGSH